VTIKTRNKTDKKKNMWHKIMVISDWFGEMGERYKLVRDFNKAAKNAYISGFAPTLLEVKITSGESEYRHAFSKWMSGGFRIKALSGRALNKSELIEVGRVVLDNDELVRKLISLGWDTLEVHDNAGYNGYKWKLMEFSNLGGILN
jgi:hypothetical protein